MSAKVLSFTNQTQLDASLALKAPIANPALTGYCTLTSSVAPYIQLNSATWGQGLFGVANWYGVHSNFSHPGDTVLRSSNGKKMLVQSGDNGYWGSMIFDSSNSSYPTITSYSSAFNMNSDATVTGLLTTSGLTVQNQSTFTNLANFGNEVRSTSTQNGNVANTRFIHSNNASILRQDDTFFYILVTDVGTPTSNFNALRPLTVTNSTGDVAMGSNVRVGPSSTSALPARFAVASGVVTNTATINTWDSTWSIFGGDGTASSSSLALGSDSSNAWLVSRVPGAAWKTINSRASSHNWYDSANGTPFLSGSGAGVVLNTALNMGSYNITSGAGVYAFNITAQGTLHGTSLSVNSDISGKTLQLFTAGIDLAGNITGTSLTLTGGVTCGTIRSSELISSGVVCAQTLKLAANSFGVDSSGNLTGASVIVSGAVNSNSVNTSTVNAITVNAQFMNVSCLLWEGNTNISGALSVSGNISGLSLNAGVSSLGALTASSLSSSGNVSGASLNAGASVLGNLTAANITAADLNLTGTLTTPGMSLGLLGTLNISGQAIVDNLRLTNGLFGSDSLGNVSAASLSATGNVSAASFSSGNLLYAGASKFGLFGQAANASGQFVNISALNVTSGLTGEECGSRINLILNLLSSYGLMA